MVARDKRNTPRTWRQRLIDLLEPYRERTASIQTSMNLCISAGGLDAIDLGTFGLFTDAQGDPSCAITAGQYVLTSPNNPWTSADVGKDIHIQSAGPAGGTLETRIFEVTSPGEIVLYAPAVATIAPDMDSPDGIAVWGTLAGASSLGGSVSSLTEFRDGILVSQDDVPVSEVYGVPTFQQVSNGVMAFREIGHAAGDGFVWITDGDPGDEHLVLGWYDASAATLYHLMRWESYQGGRRLVSLVDRLRLGGTGDDAVQFIAGTGSPEGAVSAPPGSVYSDGNGGASGFYRKESGTGDTGWVAVGGGSAAMMLSGPERFRIFTTLFPYSVNELNLTGQIASGSVSNLPNYGGHYGVVRCRTGSAASAARYGALAQPVAIVALDAGATRLAAYAAPATALMDGTSTGRLLMGFANAVATAPTDGIFFRCQNGGNWHAVCISGSTETAVDTGVAAVLDEYHVFEIRVNSDQTSVSFLIDNVAVATITTNIPSVMLLLLIFIAFRESAVATDHALDLDWIFMEGVYNTPMAFDLEASF